MDFALGHVHEGQQVAVGVETEVKFDGAFFLTKLSPWKYGQAQIDGSGIEQVELALGAEAVTGGKALAAFKQREEELFAQARN